MGKNQEGRKLGDIANKIDLYLSRFEQDPAINTVDPKSHCLIYFQARCFVSGSKVRVYYINYQGSLTLTKAEAKAYLRWLDEGNVGKHWTALQEITEKHPDWIPSPKSKPKPKSLPRYKYRVFFHQVNQTRFDVTAVSGDAAIEKAERLWREQYGVPRTAEVLEVK